MFKKCGKAIPDNSKQISITGADITNQLKITPNADVCYPCAYVISFIFAKHEKFTSMTVENVFETLTKKNAEVIISIKKEMMNESIEQ